MCKSACLSFTFFTSSSVSKASVAQPFTLVPQSAVGAPASRLLPHVSLQVHITSVLEKNPEAEGSGVCDGKPSDPHTSYSWLKVLMNKRIV